MSTDFEFSAWLKDKLEGTKFALPALYQPASLIPLDIWKGMTLSTNSGEQQHRNVYRDGVNLTMLAGIIRGMQYDWRAMVSIDLYRTTGIQYRDEPATYTFRIGRSVARHGEQFFASGINKPGLLTKSSSLGSTQGTRERRNKGQGSGRAERSAKPHR